MVVVKGDTRSIHYAVISRTLNPKAQTPGLPRQLGWGLARLYTEFSVNWNQEPFGVPGIASHHKENGLHRARSDNPKP